MTALLLVIATAAVLTAAVRFRHGVLLAIGVGLATHYTYRSVVLALGLDDPSPAYLFSSTDGDPFHRVDLMLLVWVFVLLGTIAIFRRRRTDTASSPSSLVPILWPIAVGVIGTTTFLIASQGGLAATQRFVRLGNEGEGGTGIFVTAPAVLLVACIIRFRGSGPGTEAKLISLLGMALGCATFWAFGSRTPIIALIASFILSALLTMFERRKASLRVIGIVAVIAIILPVLAVELSTQRRLALTEGQVSEETSFSESINAIYYDAFTLAARDSGETIGELGPTLFFERSQSVVPRAVWSDKPEHLSVGKWLRREYEPTAVNGWPVGAPGDSYLALGIFGLMIGAVVSGVFADWLDRLGQRLGSIGGPRTFFELSLFWGFMLLPGGVDGDILSRGIVWVALPLLYARIFAVRHHTKLVTTLGVVK